MERLTKRFEDGRAYLPLKTKVDIVKAHAEANTKAIEHLAELEDMLESGELLKLPCKIGDTVYKVHGRCNGSDCPFNGNYGQWRCSFKGERRCEPFIEKIKFSYTNIGSIGKTIFVNKTEAEAKLKELQERGE